MFDELDKQNTQNIIPPTPFVKGEIIGKAQDIFSEVDKTVKPEPFRPRDNSLPPAGTVIPADDGWLKNKGLIAGLVLGGLIIVFGGGYLGLKYAVKGVTKEEVKNNQIKTEAPNLTEPAPVEEKAAPVSQPIEPVQPQITGPVDTDQDGLTDEEEAKVYGTEPLSADTDGDGYPDGAEIKNGFNPKGSGKLLDLDSQQP